MKKLSLAIALLIAPSLAQAWPWSQDMANQVSIKPQESVNKAGMTPFPARSQPVAGTTVVTKDMDAAKKMTNPVAADDQSVAKGKHLFDIYCAPCHGVSGKGDGYVGAKLVMTPWNLTNSSELHTWTDNKDYPDGYIWGYIALGGAVMPAYANDLSASERWHIVNYIRKVLQKAPAAPAVSPTK
ncbi:MAG: c-type cytochrome [Gallionella sp.]|nr:c-type cytochrome [Gallionella sp.]MDD4959558.1 c-type cytochrome [Gallionella sp.]